MTRRESLFSISAGLFAIIFKVLEFVALPVYRRPDMLLVLAISVGWECGFWVAVPIGFALGLFEDLIFGRALGSRAFSLLIAALMASVLKKFVNPDSWISKLLVALVSAVFADVSAYGILRTMGYGIDLMYGVRTILPATAGWAVALILPVSGLTGRFASLLEHLLPAGAEKEKEAAM